MSSVAAIVGGALLLFGPAVRPDAVQPEVTQAESIDVQGLKLRRTPDGGYVYRSAEAGFTARIRPDGTVRFRNGRIGPQQGEVNVLGFDLTRKGKRKPPPRKPFRDDLVPHGPYGAPPVLLGVGGRTGGFADAVQRTPKYKAKQRFLEATASLRRDLAAKSGAKATRVALLSLAHDLLEIWTDPKLPLSVRKERLFQAWDECSEPASEEKADDHPGARARRKIEKFIRVHAPRGRDDAFTAAELRDMNERRKSRERFAPYDRR